LITVPLVIFGLYWQNSLIPAFGGQGEIFEPASIYYRIVLYGVPVLALCMMGNNVIRAEGNPKHAMVAMIIPSIGNIALDYLFIYEWGWGMTGAAWATTASYILCFLYIFWYFASGRTSILPAIKDYLPSWRILSEIGSLGFVTLSRQAVVSVIYLFMNNILFDLGGAESVSVFGIIGRVMMFALFPVLGITQGFLPIAGYNYGAVKYDRVREVVRKSILIACGLGSLIFVGLYVFTEEVAGIFTNDQTVIEETINAMRIVFLAVPIISIQLIGAAYYQAIGKAIPALLLTLSRQGFYFLPLLLILPNFYGEDGVWASFPLADTLATLTTAYFLWQAMKKLNSPANQLKSID
jgi:putative MATE family efflux protein